MNIDYSKAQALHRMYGCFVMTTEARKQKKKEEWIQHICSSLHCAGNGLDMTAHLSMKL